MNNKNYTEKILKKIIRESIEKYLCGKGVGGNTFDTEMYKLDESLIMTYDIDKVIKILCRKFGIHESRVVLNNGVVSLFLPFSEARQMIGDIKHFMGKCGYYLNKEEPVVNVATDSYVYFFIPKFEKNNITGVVFEKCKYLYHATPSEYTERILKYGLVPKAKNAEFMYPDRIYLSTVYDKNLVNSLGVVRRMNIGVGSTYDVLAVKLEDLHRNNIKFFKDNDYKNGVYTYDNITPEALYIYKKNVEI